MEQGELRKELNMVLRGMMPSLFTIPIDSEYREYSRQYNEVSERFAIEKKDTPNGIFYKFSKEDSQLISEHIAFLRKKFARALLRRHEQVLSIYN